MKRSHLSFIFFLVTLSAFSQENEELDRRNGFKDIKLSEPIDSVQGAEFKKDIKEKDGTEGKLYEINHPDYQSIGEIPIKKIEVKTYKSLVYEILVVAEKDSRLMKAMESVLGRPVYNVREESYNWAGQKVILKFKSHSKRELEMLYRSPIVLKLMRDDKAKKVEEIADDF
jgi:hypothetical protein